MAMREFEDSAGVRWRVWSSLPLRATLLHGSPFSGGWLTFESATGERRRLAPLPERWEHYTRDRLDLLRRVARRVERRWFGQTRRPSDERP